MVPLLLRLTLPIALCFLCVTLLGVPTAGAADGVIEINQTRALAGGITPGDTPGFPVSIGEPGSYVLTSDLVSSSTSRNVVEITAQRVTLDLNGFSIGGPTTCSGFAPNPVDCAPLGTARGIYGTQNLVSLKNGTVRGMPGIGVYLSGSYVLVEGLMLQNNGADGIHLSGNSQVSRVISAHNGGRGLESGGARNHITDSVFANNGGTGVKLSQRSQLINSTSGRNLGYGLDAGVSVTYRGCLFDLNTAGEVSGGVNLGGNGCGAGVCP